MLLKFVAEKDPVLEMLKWLCEQLIEAELSSQIDADKSERSELRNDYRAGYCLRSFDTRMETMKLMVRKPRKGGYIPFFVTERKRSEAALMNVIQKAFINGVSTRKMVKLSKSLGFDSISKGHVSNITKELNDQVDEFSIRDLETEKPVLWIDALNEKIRDNGHVKNMTVHVVWVYSAIKLELF